MLIVHITKQYVCQLVLSANNIIRHSMRIQGVYDDPFGQITKERDCYSMDVLYAVNDARRVKVARVSYSVRAW